MRGIMVIVKVRVVSVIGNNDSIDRYRLGRL